MTKRVLHISCDTLGNGGVQNVIMGICRNSKNIIFDILLFSSEESFYDKEFLSLGGKIFRIPYYEGMNNFRKRLDYYIRFLRIFRGTYKILKENGPYDAVHCHNYFESGICTLAAQLAGVKVRISHCHSTSSPIKKKIYRRIYDYYLKKLIGKIANVKIGCSKQALEYLFGKDRDAFVVNNAIDLKKFDRNIYPPKKRDEINFIHIGRYCFQKNQLFLLEVFFRIKRVIEKVKLVLVGFGEGENLIREKINELGIANSVKMLPPDSDIPQLLSEADYQIFPSTCEGLGIALLEAQAMGVKCFVSTAVPPEANLGLCEYLDLKEGSEAWAKYIVDYITKNDRQNGVTVSDEVLKKYDIKEICKIYSKIYNGGMS